MLRIKKIEIELGDRTIVSINEQPGKFTLKQVSDLIIKSIFTTKLQTNSSGGSEFAQWDTAREVGMKSTSTVYRAIRR